MNNDIHGLIKSVNEGSTGAFMWEWYTTKPYADAGKVRFVGSVPTPWPSWHIAAHPKRAAAVALREFLARLTVRVREFDQPGVAQRRKNVAFIKERFGYHDVDIEDWLNAVKFVPDCTAIHGKVLADTLLWVLLVFCVDCAHAGQYVGRRWCHK